MKLCDAVISRVTKVLAESGAEISYEELLDVLWLARRLPRGVAPVARAVGEPATLSEQHGALHHNGSATPVPEAAGHDTPTAEPTTAESTDPASAKPVQATARPRAHDDPEVSAGAIPSRAVAVRAPESRLIGARQLRLGKSLRPLRQRFPDRRRYELDIARTVAAMADTGVPEPVTRQARTRWLSLALVVDDGISMVLWQRLAADIRALMERAGAFRDVRVYGLDTRGAIPSLRASPYRHRSRLLSPKTLCDPSGNTLVLIVSDGVGAAWRNGGMRQVTGRWGRCGPTAIVHALPTRLWAGTGIGARRWQVTTRRRGGPTCAWHVTDPDLPPDLVRFDSVPVPVLTPTPEAVADWALLIASPGGTALLPLWDGGQQSCGRPAADTRGIDAAEAVLRFREAASAEAYRLAAHVAAVAPVTPPVMRLVQAAIGPPTDPGHLMEVFLGGLMHEADAAEPERLPHHRRFDFASDARRILLSAVSPKELLRTTDAITRHIEAAVGRAPVFPAWVGHPEGFSVIDDIGRPFGWLREQLLTRLGIPSADSIPMTSVPDRTVVPRPVTEGSLRYGAARIGDSEPSRQGAPPYDDGSGKRLRAGVTDLVENLATDAPPEVRARAAAQTNTLVAKLWNYCNVLRDNGLSTIEYVEQLSYLLFLKMVDELAEEAWEDDDIAQVVPEGYDWKSLASKRGVELEKHYRAILDELGRRPGTTIGTIFAEAQNRITKPALLEKLVVDLIGREQWTIKGADLKGDAYEGLLNKGASDTKTGAGQYFTPRALIDAIVEVSRPTPDDIIADPACGTGGFLIAAHTYLRKHHMQGLPGEKREALQRGDHIRGNELVTGTARLAAMNMLLHGIGASDGPSLVSVGDALAEKPSGKRATLVLANPPFGRKSAISIIGQDGQVEKEDVEYDRDDLTATTTNKQLNFLQHIMSLTSIDGRAAVVLPDNVLFEGGAGEKIRRRLLNEFNLHTILRLPTGIFYAGGVKANVLFFEKKAPRADGKPHTERTWVYDFRTGQHFTLKQRPLTRAHLQDFVDAYKADDSESRVPSETPEGPWRVFEYDDLIKRDKVNFDITWMKDPALEDEGQRPTARGHRAGDRPGPPGRSR
ncbi:SAV_2336 N-terminal domain-related protein [Streptomyces sp. NBC_01013]|uniref:SAV_2336 N-terminal domain-related protein n=1 Tax=Streptomyces sp. NBC_01013 TaxID=2903718 RepID=UPI00386703AD